MNLQDAFAFILDNYINEKQKPFESNSFTNIVTKVFPNIIKTNFKNQDRLLVKSSVGCGRWANCPWIAIFDILVTTSAQTGYYPVYLFREDMKGFYLSLNQGITEAKKIYKSSTKNALTARAENFRAILGPLTKDFHFFKIDLKSAKYISNTSFYEYGNICAQYYPKENLPNEDQLIKDLSQMIVLYEKLITSNIQIDSLNIICNQDKKYYEDPAKIAIHKIIERNQTLVSLVKKKLGYKCQVCGFEFDKHYGNIGLGYIEAHHLKPISELKDTRIPMNPIKDFAVLCANCHRMIHRTKNVGDIQRFKTEFISKKNN